MRRLAFTQPGSARQPIRGLIEDQPLERLLSLLSIVDRLDGDTFDIVRYELVDRYRTNEHEQEPIAIAVTAANLRIDDSRSRDRLDEMLLMLMTTHDPLI